MRYPPVSEVSRVESCLTWYGQTLDGLSRVSGVPRDRVIFALRILRYKGEAEVCHRRPIQWRSVRE